MAALTNETLSETLTTYAKALTPRPAPTTARLGELRRGRRPSSRMIEIALVERDGVLAWDFGRGFSSTAPVKASRRAGRRAALIERPLFVDRSEPLGVNQIGKFLSDYDLKFNPDIAVAQGWTLRQWNTAAGKLDVPSLPTAPGPVLVRARNGQHRQSHRERDACCGESVRRKAAE